MTAKLTLAASAFVLAALTAAPAATAGPYSAESGDATNEYDPPVPGFVGPHGDGKARLRDPDNPGEYLNPDNVVNPAFVAWATGWADYSPGPNLPPPWATPTRVLGPVTGDNFDIVSLGDLTAQQIAGGTSPGSITLTFDRFILDGPGADFAVFENGPLEAGTTRIFAELAYVEVSSDGISFARFPSDSLTPAAVGCYGTIDPTNVYNLSGKHVNAYGQSWGTPFDLSDLLTDPLVIDGSVDLHEIDYVRIVDVPGSGDFLDASGDPIFDAWVTWGSGGADIEAVGVLHQLVAGDADRDGDVDLDDLFLVRNNLGGSGGWQEGDFDGNGVVDLNDLFAVRNNFGSGTAAAPAPEPVTITMLATGAGLLLRKRRR